MQTGNTTLRFNTLFNELHRLITECLDVSEKRDFSYCLSDIRERSAGSPFFAQIENRYGADLRTINSIRNILIHRNDWIAIPEPTLKRLEEIREAIATIEKNFHTQAIDIFGKRVFTGRDTDILSRILDIMMSRNFSHIPVYTEEGAFRGVFSLKSLALWLKKNPDAPSTEVPLRDIVIDTKNSEYLFVRNDTLVSSIDAYFHEFTEKRKKLGAIFLTPSGEPSDQIDGIITAWDLPKIYENSGA